MVSFFEFIQLELQLYKKQEEIYEQTLAQHHKFVDSPSQHKQLSKNQHSNEGLYRKKIY